MSGSPVEEFVARIEDLLAHGELNKAVEQLVAFLRANDGDLYNEVLIQAGRLSRVDKAERRGVQTPEQAATERNRIASALPGLLADIRETLDEANSPVSAPPLGGPASAVPDDVRLEKIIGADNLKQIWWLERGLASARSVCRLRTPAGLGTGFLIGADRLMTNHHVVRSPAQARESWAEFNFQEDLDGNPLPAVRYALDAAVFRTNADLDYTIVGLRTAAGQVPVADWGHLTLDPDARPEEGQHVAIIQHPSGGFKQVALTSNQVVGIWEHRLHYTTDTMPGSSGAPVFNDAWQVVALHHAGGNLQVNTSGDRRYVNEGVLISAIRADIGAGLP